VDDRQVEVRFDRLEQKIDKLTDLMTNVARVEEQLVGVNGRLKRHEYRLDENEKKIDEIADLAQSNKFVVRVATSLAASIWAGIVGFCVYLFKD